MTDFGGKTSIFSHPVYLFLRKFSLQDSRGGSNRFNEMATEILVKLFADYVPLRIWLIETENGKKFCRYENSVYLLTM
ncbi:hypothetical protein E4552_16605 [Escherichia coli]|nr:hypothetical protein [Escherichia coli]